MSESIGDIAAMVGVMVRALVDRPDAVTVATTVVGTERTCLVRVAQSDLGKIIGKGGRTARAIRIIASSAAKKHGQLVTIDFGAYPPHLS